MAVYGGCSARGKAFGMFDNLCESSSGEIAFVAESEIAGSRSLDDRGEKSVAGKRGVSGDDVCKEAGNLVVVEIYIVSTVGGGELGGGKESCLLKRMIEFPPVSENWLVEIF